MKKLTALLLFSALLSNFSIAQKVKHTFALGDSVFLEVDEWGRERDAHGANSSIRRHLGRRDHGLTVVFLLVFVGRSKDVTF